MFNLSDKDLDRLSREAAQEHDPGDVLGSRSWDKLEPRLDRDLGKAGPNPLRSVRRFAYYYVPAILLVAGVFYFVKQSHRSKQNEPSGSPPSAKTQSTPATATQPVSPSQNPEHNINSTPSAPSSAAADSAIANPATANPATANPAIPNPVAANPAASAPFAASPGHSPTIAPAHTGTSTPAHPGRTVHYPGTASAGHANTDKTSGQAASTSINTTAQNTYSNPTRSAKPTHFGKRGKGKNNALPSAATSPADRTATGETTNNTKTGASTAGSKPGAPGTSSSANAPATTNSNQPRELTLSVIRGPRSLKQRPSINDSALRTYTAKASVSTIQPGKNKSLRINRSLQFGLSVAPDFSSVNSLAGDKPGSSIGLTLDYQFANHWYLSTGLLLDKKNYAARPQDYHVPHDYYWMNNLINVEFVKGSFNMLEIPLNLRYDFSTTGSTLFFASAGFSSYLLAGENSNYYFNLFGRDVCRSFNYSNKNYLFSSVNLSVGVETGISNNLSLLIAPYVKLPSGSIGFGQVQMNSVGINFALKFAPVISRKRK